MTKPHHIARVVTLLVVAASLCGCPSYMTFHSTRTAPAGKLELGGGLGHSLVGEPGFTRIKSELTGTVRVGITDQLDAGLRLRSDLVLGAEVKLRFVDLDRLHVAIAPGIHFSVLAPAFNGLAKLAERIFGAEDLASAFAYEAHLPLLFGLPFDENILFFGPKLSFTNWNVQAMAGSDAPLGGSSVGQHLLVPGFVLGFDWQVGPHMRIQPEINVHVDLHGSIFMQAGVGFFL